MFFILPIGVEYRAERYPVVTFTLMGVNVAVWLASLIYILQGGEDAEIAFIENFWLIPAESIWYTYISTVFVHAGFLHLLGNMIYLFLFGSCVEDLIGRWRFAVFYFLGGLASDFAHIAATPEHFASEIPLGGASGAVSACIGGFVLLLHKTRINFRYFVFLFLRFWSGEFWLPAWLVISFWFLKDLFFAVLGYLQAESGGGVAFAAHVGGFLSGFALISANKFLLRLKSPRRAESFPEAGYAVEAAGEPAEAPAIYLFASDAQLGPFTPLQVRQMLELGSITPETLYWREGMDDWRSVDELYPGRM